jgi:hypothetical protein
MDRSVGMAVAVFLVANIVSAGVASILFPDIEGAGGGALYIAVGIVAAVGYWIWADPKRREDKKPPMSDLL